jgi:hypothetical protein
MYPEVTYGDKSAVDMPNEHVLTSIVVALFRDLWIRRKIMRALLAVALILIGSPAFAGDYVRGYYRNDGTYVEPHYRSNPDNSRLNNYSTQGNYNPYNGRQGTVDPYAQQPSSAYGVNRINRYRN